MTVVRQISSDTQSNGAALAEAVRLLRDNQLVAFPTETVYGLGARALDDGAVSKIFAAKGRPGSHPLIVHVPDLAMAKTLVRARAWPDAATKVAEALWPGGVTLVLPRSSLVSNAVTGGGDTVAIRCPAHSVALALLRALGEPIAAPSANRHQHVSPTTAAHVQKSLGDSVALILDGGPCSEGMESTVLDLTSDVPEILRPGAVSVEALRRVLGEVSYEPRYALAGVRASPGQDPVHYAPDARVEVLPRAHIEARAAELERLRERVTCIVTDAENLPAASQVLALPADPPGFSRGLYAALYEAETHDASVILVESPPNGGAWDAVRDRLARASARR